MAEPTPVAVKTQCSVCGLDWTLHGDEPTMDDCVRLLKVELARRPYQQQYYPYPSPNTYWPYTYKITGGTTTVQQPNLCQQIPFFQPDGLLTQ